MNVHPITTPASPSPVSPLTDAAFDSIESLTTSFAAFTLPTLETTTITEVALGYHRNQQYSITAMTTSTGAVAERYAYTAYGQPTICNASGSPIGNQQSQIANRFTYTVREWDETLGLHHFRARWMSPLAGRFLGRDPIGYEGSEWGLYEYVDSSALTFNDPFGEEKCRSVLILPSGPSKRGSMCKTGVAHSKAGVRYKACVKWDANDNGLTMEASIESQQPSAVAISLSVKQSLTVGCECIGCECLPGALSTSISGFYQFQSSNIWQYNSMGVKLTDQFHINTWIAGFISGNMIFAFGHAHAGHTFHSSVAFTKGPRKGFHSEEILDLNKNLPAVWLCKGDCPKDSESKEK